MPELPDKTKVVTIEDSRQGKSLLLVPASKTATVLTSTSNRKDKSPEYGVVFLRLFRLVAEDQPGIVLSLCDRTTTMVRSWAKAG